MIELQNTILDVTFEACPAFALHTAASDFNIINDNTCNGAFPVGNNLFSTNPALFGGGLAFNRGAFTRTFQLLGSSPAIDINAPGCSAQDQTGQTRDANCDSGAYEF